MGAVKMFSPNDLRPTIEITAFVLVALSTVVIAVRFYVRRWIVRKVNLSDYLMATALVFTWGLCACNHYQFLFGSGVDYNPGVRSKVKAEQLKLDRNALGAVATWYAYHIGYQFIMGLIKLSILVFYLGFATQRTFRRLVQISIAIVTAVTIILIFIIAFQCPKKPSVAFGAAILRDRGSIHCFDLKIILYWQAGWSIGSDVVILLLPMPLLFSLRMRTAKRLSVVAVFAVSLLIPIASAVRLWGLNLWANSGSHARYYGGYIIFWSQVEINTAIICASAPSIQPLFKRILNRILGFRQSRSPYYYYGARSSLPGLPAVEIDRDLRFRRDSICTLEMPTRACCPAKEVADDGVRDRVAIGHPAEEEELRARIRALTSPSPVYVRPVSLASGPTVPDTTVQSVKLEHPQGPLR